MSSPTKPVHQLATDLDGTLIPNADQPASREALRRLAVQLKANQIELIFVTGRHFESVIDMIQEHELPLPSWILCDVGTSVYRRLDDAQTAAGAASNGEPGSVSPDHYAKVQAYDEQLNQITDGYPADQLRHQLSQIAGLRLQEDAKQGLHKISFYAPAEKLPQCVADIERMLEDLSAPYGIISSVDPFNGEGLIDLMPRGVSKAYALQWWCEQHNHGQSEEIVFAGDSGNDLAALVAGYRAIVVGNADRVLARNVAQTHQQAGWTGRLFLAEQHSTAGVEAGCRWYGLIPDEEMMTQTDPANIDPAEFNPADVDVTELNRWLGATPVSHDATRFCVWAPRPEQLSVEVEGQPAVPMQKTPSGYHLGAVQGATDGSRYRYRLGDDAIHPDPASRYQPEGVHGPSQVVSRSFPWTDANWKPPAKRELVIYELHVGTFTNEGTFAAAIERLDELVELGITAIELMPVAGSAGRWNWGYDGVNFFAPQTGYGTPDQLRRLVDAAHAKGLAVIVDVVYNHYGPEGNYLSDFGGYISARHHTVWGAAPNFDEEPEHRELRRFIIANAIHWYDEYHIDGLRVDAIHCMLDDSEPHVVRQLGEAVDRWSQQSGRTAMLIAESNVYDPNMLAGLDQDGMGFDAEWCDDFLHSVFAAVRPGEQLTDREYEPGADLAQTLKMGFIYEGTVRRPRQRRPLMNRVDSSGLVYSIQNHDFIGNHPLGLRLHQLTSHETQRAAAALLLLTPAIPMLFMGEEFACENPFRFFVDFGDEHLREGVVQGRMSEYPQHDWSGGLLPTDPANFELSKIGAAADGNQQTRQWYKRLIQIRQRWRASELLNDENLSVTVDLDAGLYLLRYESSLSSALVAVRLSDPRQAADPIELDEYVDCRSLALIADSTQADAMDVQGDSLMEQGAARQQEEPIAPEKRRLLRPNHALVFAAQR